MNGAFGTLLLLLLALSIYCDASEIHNDTIPAVPKSLCEGDICHVSPNNFWRLNEIISSNKLIVLNGGEFSVDDSNGSILIENVSNLTISGRQNGSLIECSSDSTFGLYLKNTTNVTLTGIRIRNCSFLCHPHDLIQNVMNSSQPRALMNAKTSILIETSINLVLSDIYIEYSPGYALIVVHSSTGENSDDLSFVNPDLRITDCKISYSRKGAMLIYGKPSILIERSVIAGCDAVSYAANIMIRNVDMVNCTCSMDKGHMLVGERLRMRNSSLHINNQQYLVIREGRVSLKSNSKLYVYNSEMIVAENSTVVFMLSQSHHAMYIESSILQLDNSTLSVTECTRSSNRFSIFYSTNSQVNLNNGSSLVFTNNLVTGYAIVLISLNTSFSLTGAKLLFENNKCQNHSTFMYTKSTTIKLREGASVNFAHNKVMTGSKIHTCAGGLLEVNNSALIIAKTSMNNSIGLLYISSTIILIEGKLLFEKNLCIQSRLTDLFHTSIIQDKGSSSNFTSNKIYGFSFLSVFMAGLLEVNGSSLTITNNKVIENSTVLYWKNPTVVMNAGELLFKKNECQDFSSLMQTFDANMKFDNESFFTITCNYMHQVDYSRLLEIHNSSLKMSLNSTLLVSENVATDGILVISSSNNNSLGGIVLSNNNISRTGVMNIISSTVWFQGSVDVAGNRASSGGITATDSDLFFTRKAAFIDNEAANGGAVTLISSVMYISPTAAVDFTRNYAKGLGGAIYIYEPRTKYVCSGGSLGSVSCSIQVLSDNISESCNLFSLSFHQNKAYIAGNAIYGDHTLACLPSNSTGGICYCQYPNVLDVYQYNGVNDSSDLSNFTSDPTRVCFCKNDIPDCYKVMNNITVHPGETFNLSLVIVGYGLGTVPGSVIARNSNNRRRDSENNLFGSESQYSQEIRGTQCKELGYSIVSERDREQMALAVDSQSFGISLEEIQAIVEFKKTGSETFTLYKYNTAFRGSQLEAFFHIPVLVEVDLLPCPVGFQLVRGRCVCHQILLNNNIDTCFFYNGTGFILRPAPYWIGLPNDTNSSMLIHPHCPFDYCQLQDINITAESPNTQCWYQRSGILCGSCREGLSMILGSSECKTCSNVYLTSIAIFFVMGVALVALLTLLNMTVSVGTLNGLILFANILQANQTTFLPPTTSHGSSLITFLSTFIAWVNLDLGIPMCFFDGLTTYVKTWLHFLFPLYILTLVGVMIVASNYSTLVTRLLGTNTVSVLATLVLLSYTKILRILITAFSFTTLTGSQDYHSVVWLADGNIKYFEPKHTILFLVALLVLLLLGVPYTVTLTAIPWIQSSRFKWMSSLYNRFKPLFDAYMGPYKDRHRYWTGMLLLARVFLIVLFSSIANTNTVAGPQLNLLFLTLSSFALFGLTAALKPYKKRLLNGLEIFYLTILFIFSSSNLYVSNIGTGTGPRQYIYIVLVGISFLVFLGICVGHVWYRVRKARTGRRPQPLEEDENDWHPSWQRAHVRAEDEDEEEENVTIRSTAGATNNISNGGRRESLVELIAHI